jgi:ATP-binding cassette subfamily F protein uup
MNVIDVSEVHKSYGPRTIMNGVTFIVGEGEKVGVVGRNGCGKSTLLKILAAQESPDSGEVRRKRGLTADYLPQEPPLDPALTIRQTLDAALAEAQRNRRRFQEVSDALTNATGNEAAKLLEEQHQLQDWLDLHQGWNLDHKMDQVSSRLGIGDLDVIVGTLSGGWRKRVALAGMLLREPELLLLDEPTNHLDADTVAWLEEALRQYPGAVVLVTHDRYFLDRVVGRMFEMDGGELTQYTGGYSAYLEQKRERLEQEGQAQSRLANLLRREEAWLHRGAKARTTKQKARIDRVGELQQQKKDVGARDVKLDFTLDQRLGGTILELRDLDVRLGGKELLEKFSFILRKGERIGILGPNGCGKTTLLKTVLGEIAPAGGEVVLGKNTRIGYLDQERSGLDEDQFVPEALGEGEWVTVGDRKRHKIGYLEDFLFTRDEQRKRISTLSGGERARLLLAKLMLEGANLLILDEPTNDLDIPTMQVLEEAFNEYPGCVLVVTHDRWFLDRVATGILHFEGEGEVTFHTGNYEDFQRFKAMEQEEQRERQKAIARAVPAAPREKKRTGLGYKEKLELETVEQEIEKAEGRKLELERLLGDPSRLEGSAARLEEVGREFAELDARLGVLFERWEVLELKREGAG